MLQGTGSFKRLGRAWTFFIFLFFIRIFVLLAGLAVCPELGCSDRGTWRIVSRLARSVGWRWWRRRRKPNAPLILSILQGLRGRCVRRRGTKSGRVQWHSFSWCCAGLSVQKSGCICFHKWRWRSARFKFRDRG